jgi:hypothetical protein
MGLLQFQGLLGSALLGVLAAGASPLDAASPSKGGGEEADGGSKGGYSGT